MKKLLYNLILSLLIISIVCTSTNVTYADDNISVNADSAILMEKESKRVLYSKNIDERKLTASICKILTAIISIENLDLNKYVKVTKEATMQIGSSIYLKENDEITVKDLLYGLLLRSGNDAAYLLACEISNNIKEFSDVMNEYAKKIKMYSSSFTNPSGLDDNTHNYSSAYDMALLMCYCLDNKIFCEISKTLNYSSKTKQNNPLYFNNKHKLIAGYNYIIAGKTGYTEKAKRTLITSAKKDGMILVAVTFNCSNDWNEHLKLFEYGYNNYKNVVFVKNQIIKMKNFDYKYIPYLPISIKYPIKENEKSNVKIFLLNNPKKDDYILGYAKLYINGFEVKKYSIYRYY